MELYSLKEIYNKFINRTNTTKNMKVDKIGKEFIQTNYTVFDADIDKYEYLVNDLVRVPINVSCITQNAFNALVSIAIGMGKETFTNSNLVKYINNTVNINIVTLGNQLITDTVMKFVKSAIGYWILNSAVDKDSLELRKKEVKLYFS